MHVRQRGWRYPHPSSPGWRTYRLQGLTLAGSVASKLSFESFDAIAVIARGAIKYPAITARAIVPAMAAVKAMTIYNRYVAESRLVSRTRNQIATTRACGVGSGALFESALQEQPSNSHTMPVDGVIAERRAALSAGADAIAATEALVGRDAGLIEPDQSQKQSAHPSSLRQS